MVDGGRFYARRADGTWSDGREALGFDDKGLMRGFRMGMVSVGGYHHHIGLNTWQEEGAAAAPADAAGLRRA